MDMPNPHPLFDHENFNFKQLRQTIIHYAIHDGIGNVSKQDVANCRLVCSDWLEITTRVLRQSREPLFHLKLDKEHNFKGKGYFNKSSCKLELDLMETKDLHAPPVDLKIIEGNWQMRGIGGQLSRIGNNLVSMEASVTPKSSRLLFPEDLSLPLLQSLSIVFTQDTPEAPTLSLQSVFNSCPELEVLEFLTGSDDDDVYSNVVLPADFTRVIFPETLTTLHFSKLKTQHFEVLANSKLPNLKWLTVVISRHRLPDGLFTRVLENFKSSLEGLGINRDNCWRANSRFRTYFRFPVMEKLKCLGTKSMHLELEPGIQSLETFLPKLTVLWMDHQTSGMLSKWTQSMSQLSSVTSLFVSMHDDNQHFHKNLNETVVREMACTFPNVKELRIDFVEKDYSALTAVWQHMKQVEGLTLCVPPPKHFACQDPLTSGLLGVTSEMAANYRTKQTKSLKLGRDSIKQMSNLKCLHLLEVDFGQHKNKKKVCLVSDSVFEMALLEMPQLTEIVLAKKFRASELMINKWEEKGGRKISFYDKDNY